MKKEHFTTVCVGLHVVLAVLLRLHSSIGDRPREMSVCNQLRVCSCDTVDNLSPSPRMGLLLCRDLHYLDFQKGSGKNSM